MDAAELLRRDLETWASVIGRGLETIVIETCVCGIGRHLMLLCEEVGALLHGMLCAI